MSADIRIESLDAFLARSIPEIPWIVRDLIPGHGLISLAGAPKAGKTTLALGLAVAASIGHAVLGRASTPTRTLFVGEEGGERSLQDRLSVLRAAIAPQVDDTPMSLAIHQVIRLDTPGGLERLGIAIEAAQAKLVILDCLVRMHGLEENDARDMALVTGGLERIAAKTGSAVLFIHHVAKVSEDSAGGYAMRGSSVLASSTEANLVLRRSASRTRLDAQLRDSSDVHLALDFDPETLLFTATDRPPQTTRRKAPSERDVLDQLQVLPDASVDQLAASLEVSDTTVRPILARLTQNAQVISSRRRTGRGFVYRVAA